MRSIRELTLCTILLSACSGISEDMTVLFPTEEARSVTRSIAVSVFEPVLSASEDEPSRFVSCPEVSVFPPIQAINPDGLENLNRLGQLLLNRETQSFPFQSDWSLSFDRISGDDPDNPWGALMVLVEARGDASPPDAQMGAKVPATFLSGCYCVRTAEGSHPDQALDQRVKNECPLVGEEVEGSKERNVVLEPVAPKEFRLEACEVQNLAAPKNQPLAPGPAVCLSTVRCDNAPFEPNCFECEQPCDELDDLSNVPILFTVDQPGGGTEPLAQLALTDAKGIARASVNVDDCSQPLNILTQVAGRTDDPVRFSVECVDQLGGFACGAEIPLMSGSTVEPKHLAKLPGPPGQRDMAAVLQEEDRMNDEKLTHLHLINPSMQASGADPVLTFPGEEARGVFGYFFSPSDPVDPRPILAVATSVGEDLIVRLFLWDGATLTPHDGLDGAIREACLNWDCGSLRACTPATQAEDCNNTEVCHQNRCVSQFDFASAPNCALAGPVGCGCKPTVDFGTAVSFSATDVNGDGLMDLGVATSNQLPLTIYFSDGAQAGLYQPQDCTCGLFAQSPAKFELLQFGGPGEGDVMRSSDLVVGAAAGTFVRYSTPLEQRPVLSCGQMGRVGDLVPVRDVAKGRFRCDPASGPGTCSNYEDVVVVAAKVLGGGSFDDPGTIRVIFGDAQDLADDDIFGVAGSNVELVPREIEARGEPKDPRTVEVADFNGDGHDDVAVLFGASGEFHVWLGASNQGLGEVAGGIVLETCDQSIDPSGSCASMERFATPDFDGDGRAEIAVICNPTESRRTLRWFSPNAL